MAHLLLTTMGRVSLALLKPTLPLKLARVLDEHRVSDFRFRPKAEARERRLSQSDITLVEQAQQCQFGRGSYLVCKFRVSDCSRESDRSDQRG